MERSRINWQAVSTVIAVLSLAAALAFNGYQLSQTRRAAELQTRAVELQTFLQVHTLVQSSVYRVGRHQKTYDRAIELKKPPAAAAEQALNEAMANADFLAWIFNRGYVNLPGARSFWASVIACEYVWLYVPMYGKGAVKRDLPNLTAFVSKTPASERPCG